MSDVFIFKYISGADVESFDVSKLNADDLQQVEADSYWCMAKLLDGIQDNYTFAQPGIQKKVHMLKELMQRIDGWFNTSFEIMWTLKIIFIVGNYYFPWNEISL